MVAWGSTARCLAGRDSSRIRSGCELEFLHQLLHPKINMPRNLIGSDTALRSIKPGDPRRRISDGDGLYILLFVNGGAHGWRFDYSFAGKRKTLSLGTYPTIGIALARERAEDARRKVAQGIDPSEARKAV